MAAIGLLHLISIPRRIKAPLCIIPFFRTPQQVTIPRGRHSSCSPLGASLMSWQGTRHFLISHGQEYPTHGQEYPTNIAPNHRPIPPWLCSSTPDDQGASPPPLQPHTTNNLESQEVAKETDPESPLPTNRRHSVFCHLIYNHLPNGFS